MMAWKMKENKIFVLEFEHLCASFERSEDWKFATGFRVRTPKISINQRSNAKKKNSKIVLGVQIPKIQRN